MSSSVSSIHTEEPNWPEIADELASALRWALGGTHRTSTAGDAALVRYEEARES